eukprot:TRINITY_DN2022_c0_g2_i2.p1 TRINITY_DN2022_c0_g2~~TRINITY_DN2022_c0_g2_i2.p1  ORF type:complete len:1150 (+),score=280.83 TRINITY_DN2022_c0_g2_i2:75-3524(+)
MCIRDRSTWDRSLHLGKKAISMICSGHTKAFKEDMILEVFPKLLITIIYQLMDEKRHCSIRILRIITHIHSIFLLFLETYPKLYQDIEKTLAEFIKDEGKRHKDVVSNLGAFLTFLLVSFKFKFEDVGEAYVSEQLDRQVFWILKSIPELVENDADPEVNRQRAQVTFKNEIVSYQILCGFAAISRYYRKTFKSPKDILEFYEQNHCRLSNAQENEIQKLLFEVQKIDNYSKFFAYLGLGNITDQEVTKRLHAAIGNSKRKKYHGTDDEILTLPKSEEQLRLIKEKVPQIIDCIDEAKMTLKDGYKPEDWKNMVLQRWNWIKRAVENNSNLNAAYFAKKSDDLRMNLVQDLQDPIIEAKNGYLRNLSSQEYIPELVPRYDDKYEWRDLFIKLDIEEQLIYFDLNPDFKNFYKTIQACKDYIRTLILPLIPIKNIKSGYYYITALLTQLTSLQHLGLVGLNENQFTLSQSLLKSLSKGFNNFVEKGGKMLQIIYHNFTIVGSTNEIQEALFKPLHIMPDLKSLSISKTNMLNYNSSFNGGKEIANFIINRKGLIELNLINANINAAIAKEIADGLMRAKQIQKIDIRGNNIGSQGLTSIVYNLAFSPSLQYLNLSRVNVDGNRNEFVEALYKLLRITTSLEILNLSLISGLNPSINIEFMKALGEIKSLKLLDLSHSGNFASGVLRQLGMAIAFNAKNGCSLKEINLDGTLRNYNEATEFHDAMNISTVDYTQWYGDSSKINKMSGTDYQKHYYNNLESIQMNNTQNLQSSFNLTSWKKQYNPIDPGFVRLIATSKNLTNLQLSKCSLVKNDAELLTLALDPTRPNFQAKIKTLNLAKNKFEKEGMKILAPIFSLNNILTNVDLSGNKIGVSGAQALAAALEKNSSIRFLNLYGNIIDVDGARAFQKTLCVNTTLEFIDFGFNRLRDEGLSAIANGIVKNKSSSIKSLGLRYNFISDTGIVDLLKTLHAQGEPKLSHLFIRNNSIYEMGLYNVSRMYQNLKSKIKIDLLEKLNVLDNDRLERTIWIHPSPGNLKSIKDFFEVTHNTGVVLNIRERKGPKWPNKKNENKFVLVEFAHPTSVTRALHVASRKLATLNGVNFRIFKAGSGTFIYQRIKRKNMMASQTNTLPAGGAPRGRGRGRPRGARGRGGR